MSYYASAGKSDGGPEPVKTAAETDAVITSNEDHSDAISGNGNVGEPHGRPEVVGVVDENGNPAGHTIDEIKNESRGLFAYFKTRDFYIALILGQVLSLCITSTNTFSSLLAMNNNSIPTLQLLLNYICMNLVYSLYTMYKYGIKGWARMVFRDGWKYFILAFMDVEGNYFTVLAYRYTTILSAQLINFWAIVVVVVVSALLLKVRYHWTQIIGILVCCGGMGLLIASDHITGANGGHVPDQLKGDLFALLGATIYGLTNITEEFLVSKRPLYEVVGQLAFWATIICGVQSAIFDRTAWRTASWDGKIGGYLSGFTICLFIFYSLAPIMFRVASAAFMNISLLTANFWGVIIGIHVFHLTIHYLYPIAFVLILVGLFIYFMMMSRFGDAVKPWLGSNQERGVSGIGTAKRRVEKPDAIV